MTLDTHIRVLDPTPVEPLFRYCQSLLGDPAAQEWTDADCYGTASYRNKGGQGLAAWLILTYGQDGPLPKDEDDSDEPAACIDVSFDTAYGYSSAGAGCGDLHAWLVTMVTAWLDDRGARWCWQDEGSGDWLDSLDELEQRLGDPARGALWDGAGRPPGPTAAEKDFLAGEQGPPYVPTHGQGITFTDEQLGSNG